MNNVLVRYKVKPGQGEANAELVRAVFAELAATAPDGIRYATFQLEDGVTFVHIARIEGDGNPLGQTAAFGQFQAELASRCEEPPVVQTVTVVGDHRLLAE